MLKKINVYKLFVGGGLACLAASAAIADDTDSRITTYKNNGLLPANYVAPTLSSVDSGDVVEFSPASLSWVSEDVVAAQASAWHAQFSAFYDMTKEEWLALFDPFGAYQDEDGLKFLGLVENGKITDAAINAADAAEIAGSTLWEFYGSDLSDVKYWPSIDQGGFYGCTFGAGVPDGEHTSFMCCTFNDAIPTQAHTYYECAFGNILPPGTHVMCSYGEGELVASAAVTIQSEDNAGSIIARITNPEVVSMSGSRGFTSIAQAASLAYAENCYLPDNEDMTYAQAQTLGVLSGRNYMGENSYIIADENCSNIFENLGKFKGVTASMLDQTKTNAILWGLTTEQTPISPEQYETLVYPLIRADVIANMNGDSDEWDMVQRPTIYFTDGGWISGTELYCY